MIKGLICTLILVTSTSVFAGEISISNKSNEATIERLENKQVHMLAKILHKKGRGMIDQKINDDQKLARQSFSKHTSHLLEDGTPDQFQN